MVAEPPEVQSIKSMLHIAKLIAIIFGILFLLGGIAYVAFLAFASTVCSGYDAYCGGAVIGALIGAVWIVIGGVVAIIVYMQMNSIEAKVNDHQYEAAKSQTLIWVVLGFIFGIILGIILLVAWLKFDPLITWQRNQGGAPPAGYTQYAAPMYAPPAQAAPAPVAPPPPAPPAAAPAPAPAPFCVKCGKPTTYIAQYGRYYCYADNLYV
jgi:uncharacterized membrane protein YidH (DUF202 family)